MRLAKAIRTATYATALGFALSSGPIAAQDAGPLSAIDWLTQNAPPANEDVSPTEPPIAEGAATPEVTVTPLGAQTGRRLGLLPAAVTGLPPQLWSGADAEILQSALSHAKTQRIPAAQELLLMLLLAESDDLPDRAGATEWLRARLGALKDLGAVEPALAFLEQAKPEGSPALFPIWLDLALLARADRAPCTTLTSQPAFSPSQAARIYCTARAGDVDTAALLYGTAAALGMLNSVQEPLLARFLDPDLFGQNTLPRAPVRPDPLTFRLYEAAGAPLPTQPLPLAFAHSDLSTDVGWKARLEAAERLARAGVLPSNQLLGLYTQRKPAASGGIWDRIAALQAFEADLQDGEASALNTTLPAMWRGMQSARLEVVFSDLFAEPLTALQLAGDAAEIAFKMAMISRNYEATPLPDTSDITAQFLASVAQGTPTPDLASTPMAQAVATAFGPDALPSEGLRALGAHDVGLTLLSVLGDTHSAGRGDLPALRRALTDLRVLGLEDIARRTALQALILLDQG